MDEKMIFKCTDRQQWRDWLSEHFETCREVWFVLPQKDTEEGVSYNDAVEEALCFGWIDSTVRHIDPLQRAQRFTPRRKGSSYSQPNIERLKWLDSQGMIHPKVRPSVAAIIESEFSYPEDILSVLRKDEMTWWNYQAFPDSYKRIRIAYIEAARKRPEEFKKRLKNFVSRTAKNRIITGYGGVEKYYRIED